MENNKSIFVYRVAKCYPENRGGTIYSENFNIKGIDNSKTELILTGYNEILKVPFSQLKWGPIRKFLHKTECVYVVYDILLNVPIDTTPEFLTVHTIFSPPTIRIQFNSSFSVKEKNIKCSNVMFCIKKNAYDPIDSYGIAKYLIPLTKILLFVAGHADPKSPVSRLIKDIFPIIYEFYQQVYPLLEADNI